MTHPNARLHKLTSSSLRMNKGVVVLCGLASMLVGLSVWGLNRMVAEQRDAVRYHFARLMENMGEQDLFLSAIAQQSAKGLTLNTQRMHMSVQEPMPEQDSGIYRAKELSFSLPFSVKINPTSIEPSERPKVFALGAHLASYYSAFWSASHYQSPQVFLFNVPDNFDIAVPPPGELRGAGQIQGGTFQQVLTQVLQCLQKKNPQPLDSQVHWVRYGAQADKGVAPTVLAYINVDLPASQLDIEGASPWVVVASLLNLSQINDIERIMEWSIYDRFGLTAPNGSLLVGTEPPDPALSEGLNVRLDGLVFKISSEGPHPWTAVYVVGFKSFIDYAWWPLLGVLTLIIASIGGGWAFSRWYKTRVVLPAHQAHQSISESEAFSRAVIDAAPTGLCVVRRSDHQVLLENQRIQEWQQSDRLIAALDQKYPLTSPGQTDLEIEGHHLHVGVVDARYHGEDVWICAFHDVTRHIDDAAALEQALRAADSANEAKTRFLATMSHEIRTPLYGVLGTLELLGLTDLGPRQQEYLRTIQRSSATLFQLISDVLDVSKIESGQMTIEAQDFCPLELTEDTLCAYSAFAEAKGLQLYACIDSAIPDRVQGDPLRIRQILNNLLSNAIKFTDNGRVVLRLRLLDLNAGGANLQWQVSDSGIGISQAQQSQLFDPFYQVRDASSEAGAGLGLAICWWLCELMAGQLKVVSEPGLGSSFSLQLHLACAVGQLSDCPEFAPDAPPIYVQAPAPELAQHVCNWFNRLGQETRILGPDAKNLPGSSALLLDVLPSSQTAWGGPRVIATTAGANPAEYTAEGWSVDAHDIRAMAWAVSFAQQGVGQRNHTALTEQARRLDLNILIAEDNPINRAIIKEQLEALGCTVVATADGEQALHQWLPGLFDMVLTDVNMPVMNGYELTKALRRNDADLPIIGVTANALRDEGERCAAVGMNAWLVKPLNLHTLRTQLLKHCKAANPLPLVEPDQPAHIAQIPDQPQLSPKMRTLFFSTMQQDIDKVTASLRDSDAAALGRHLHSMAGALGAVQAGSLADACISLESRLEGHPLTPALATEVSALLERLAAMLDALA
ncbi:hybrid sensor histidine kinase/response regulator [Pseudomonas sp. FW306-02-F08-AA]|uniref:hybrid sensor histidine kinase/response regulator n=1 Tax=Pseudomonas sp. FW306-02-F08-AA TaxID=2070651 RepID=UPI000C881D4A|nr:hybrid sensor histidine kinase/response regulator [Pseudomonas sp. FW306-02-F08-AA]PMZ21892.1 hybrid sensor histidine kinase/response regulator [Pseudomonas sp. FW306-02-F08-AA]